QHRLAPVARRDAVAECHEAPPLGAHEHGHDRNRLDALRTQEFPLAFREVRRAADDLLALRKHGRPAIAAALAVGQLLEPHRGKIGDLRRPPFRGDAGAQTAVRRGFEVAEHAYAVWSVRAAEALEPVTEPGVPGGTVEEVLWTEDDSGEDLIGKTCPASGRWYGGGRGGDHGSPGCKRERGRMSTFATCIAGGKGVASAAVHVAVEAGGRCAAPVVQSSHPRPKHIILPDRALESACPKHRGSRAAL